MAKRLLSSLSGVLLVAVSVSLFTYSGFGTDPFTCFVIGMHNLMRISYGLMYLIVNLAIVVIVLFVDRRQFGLATPITIFVSGFVTDGVNVLLHAVFPAPSLPLRVVFLVCGVVVTCVGSAFYYSAELGVSAYDSCARTISRSSGLPFRYCRIGTDALCVAVGFLFGATVGAGTLVTAFFMGPLISFFSRSLAVPLLWGDGGVPSSGRTEAG